MSRDLEVQFSGTSSNTLIPNVLSFLTAPVAILNNDRELGTYAVINSFNIYFSTNKPVLNLRCFSIDGHGDLQWQTKDVAELPEVLDSSLDIPNLELSYSGDRDVIMTLHPFAEGLNGTYTCASLESGFETDVIATFTDPYWQVITPSEYQEPIGVVIPITAVYGDGSNGYINNGAGFSYELKFIPCAETQPEEVLASGVTDSSSNELTYSFVASLDSTGAYQLRGKNGETYVHK